MKLRTMTSITALTLLMAHPAHAIDAAAKDIPSETSISTVPTKDTTVMDDVKSGLRHADEGMRDTADDIKAWLIGKNEDDKLKPILIRRNMTAHGLIGQPIVNAQSKRIAIVKDIIMSSSGKAILVVVSDESGFLGIGDKVAAFDYSRVVSQNQDGKVVMALSEDMVSHAADFSYKRKDWNKAKVIPLDSISTNTLLEGNLLDSNNKEIANIENIYFRDADVSQVIVGFNKTLGIDGDFAALDYDTLKMVKNKGDLNFKLSKSQSTQFKDFKSSAVN